MEYIILLGKIWANLNSLEFALRAKLYNKFNHKDSNFSLYQAEVGSFLPENYLTNYDSLGLLIDKYNRDSSNTKKINKKEIVEVRDLLAHGRLSALIESFPLDAIIFSKPKNGKVKVRFKIALTEQWLQAKITFILNTLKDVTS